MYKSIKNTALTGGMFRQRYDLNRKYLMSLKSERLLQNHYGEAGLWNPWWGGEEIHEGWEAPSSSIRGHYLGHWMSAAAKMYFYHNDNEAKVKLDFIIGELERCQNENGGQWVHSCPEKYLNWLLQGKNVGVPQYNIHKTMMGLWDSYEFSGSEIAFEILINFTEYFINFTDGLSDEQMDDILDIETGGMLEIFANIYGVKKEDKYYTLMKKYVRRRLLLPLLDGKDVLTNMHANTTIPEVLGAARVYEVTGKDKYLDMVLAYWNCAVTKRGYYATGSANSGEIWCPSDDFTSRMGNRNQEHCNQYNLIRLADFLFRHTGKKEYGDYIERSIYNSIFAQQNSANGMVAYYLPLKPGGRKEFSAPTKSFWCCVGTLSQAHTNHPSYIAYQNGENNEIIISQYANSRIAAFFDGKEAVININADSQSGHINSLKKYDAGSVQKPKKMKYNISVDAKNTGEFIIKMRIPWWVKNTEIFVNGEKSVLNEKDGFIIFSVSSGKCFDISVGFERELMLEKMPDNENLTAVMDGPFVLAAISDKENLLPDCDINKLIRPLDARNWGMWSDEYILELDDKSVPLKRLCDITDENYSVYFRLCK